MFEHPSHTYSRILIEQERIDRANELRRIVADNPARIVRRRRRRRRRALVAGISGWFRSRRREAVASAAPAEHPCAVNDSPVRPAHAR